MQPLYPTKKSAGVHSAGREVSISLQIHIYMVKAMLDPKAKGQPINQKEW